jgi:stage II sporulation protein D
MRPAPLLAATLLLAALAGLGARSGAAATQATAPVFVLTGHGWGHGVGMSQWGALGQAQAGRTYAQILAHYYRGTTLGSTGAQRVRVLVAEGRRRLAVSSPAPFRVRAGKVTYRLPARRVAVGPRPLRVQAGGKRRILRGELLFLPGAAPLELDGAGYRGALRISREAGGLRAVNVVPLEAYLRGVVPLEVPKHWPHEVLKAQAVAARSYALARRLGSGPFDLYSDWRSQMYGGIRAEAPTTDSAVKATALRVLRHGGGIATTFFHSTSGGRTASAAEVFGDDVPYLVSVADPWDRLSPLHAWEPRQLDARQLGRLFGAAAVVDASVERAPSGRSARIRLTTRAGTTLELAATAVRDRLGLRSAWVRLGMLHLVVPDARVRAGDRTALTGIARDLERPVLERLLPGGAWERVRRVAVRGDGTFTAMVRPDVSVRYRLSAEGFSTRAVSVRVVPAAAAR